MKKHSPLLSALTVVCLSMPTIVPSINDVTAADPSKSSLIPARWDAVLAGDQVLDRLTRVSASQVQGAHDAEFVCIEDRAYIVEHDNDVQPGHGAGKHMYCVLSIVNLKTLKLEKTIPMAKSEQAFKNVTLPVGECFVPRIHQVSESTLRCYFASQFGNSREASTWYRDFNVRTENFEGEIHKVKLRTTAGVFDMEPRHFHADAAAQGFTKPAVRRGLYLFDSFKQFDGKTYVAINNFPGKQNALALVRDNGTTFEIVGHYNEPQTQRLSESAINQLPDGTWMAICRNDGGNYHFTTSVDGKSWDIAKEMSFVQNGLNSKPTFDKFGGVYYLGWQETTRIDGCRRSVFNVDISNDGRKWQRKYRFETSESFQYPTFHEHEGVIWLAVSQSDHKGSTDRIMFGKLEDVGEFESQAGKTHKPRVNASAAPTIMKQGIKLFTDRDYQLHEMPKVLEGLRFLRGSIESTDVTVTSPGLLYALTPTKRPKAASRETELRAAGFVKADVAETQFFPGDINRVGLYHKRVRTGERLPFGKFVFFVMGEGTAIRSSHVVPPGTAPLPAFKGPTAGVTREINLPLIDLSLDTDRHSVVAAGTESVYQGHCDTVLLPDGKTMFTAWCLGHAQWVGPIAKSTDAGRTWGNLVKVPDSWYEASNTPALHRLVAPDGKARLFCFSDGLDWTRQGKPPYPMHQSYSEDDGDTWTPMIPNGVQGEVPPKTVLTFNNGKRLVMWSDLPGKVIQSESFDGGLSWTESRSILSIPARWGQPCVVRSPDGKTLLMLLRENSQKHNSLFSLSHDDATTWTAPRELPAALTGDRHVARFVPDGRLVVAFRDVAHISSTYGHYVAWVGNFEDIINGTAGDYRLKLFNNAMRTPADKPGQGSADCGYSDLEVLPDGTVIATTYLKYATGPEKHSVMNTRFHLTETDALARAARQTQQTP